MQFFVCADNRRRVSGGVSLRIVLALATLAVVGVSIVYLLQTQQKRLQVHHRKALEISEFGLFQALQRLRNDPDWRSGLDTTAYNEGWFVVRVHPQPDSAAPVLHVVSEGHSGSVSQTKTMILRKEPADGDSVWVRREMR